MTPLFDGQDYYKKMLELQEKLRKSEEERIRLEERFNLLEQESRIRHEACINKLRMRYIEFLEEQRLRDERNNKLLGALDRVDSSLALMSAKTDKLYALRKEYEASMLRTYASRRQAGSVTGDSGIMSQAEDRRAKPIRTSPTFASASNTSLHLPAPPRGYDASSNFFAKPYPTRSPLNFPAKPSVRDLEPTWGYSTPRVEVSYADESFRRSPRFLSRDTSPFQYPETIRSPKTSKLSSMLNLKEEKAGNVVESELERYITKIRSLHGDLDPSLEELDPEQNTSGDLLNVTLSDDGLDHLPVEEKREAPPDEMNKVLALAEDLASRAPEPRPPDEQPATPVVATPAPQIASAEVAQSESAPEVRAGPEELEARVEALKMTEEEPPKSAEARDASENETPEVAEPREENAEAPERLEAAEATYQDPNATYNYENQAQYQYEAPGDYTEAAEGQYQYEGQYNYPAEGARAPTEYEQHENYDPNAQYPAESYADPNAAYTGENYAADPNAQYSGENYAADPNAQYADGSYQQGDGQYHYEGQQYQGAYPADAGQAYDTQNYGYSYEQGGGYPAEGYEGYQAAEAAPSAEIQEPSAEEQLDASAESSAREADQPKKKKDVIKSILESETESSIEKNTSHTESDFDFN